MGCPLQYKAGLFPQQSNFVSCHQHQQQSPLLRIRSEIPKKIRHLLTIIPLNHTQIKKNNIIHKKNNVFLQQFLICSCYLIQTHRMSV